MEFFATEENKKKAGIYMIINMVNLMVYVGSAICFQKRYEVHLSTLKNNNHRNQHLQNSYNKYGYEAFVFVLVEIVKDKLQLTSREDNWIKLTKCCNLKYGYNILPIAGSQLGIKRTNETKQKISTALKHKFASETERKKKSETAKKRWQSEEYRTKQLQSQKKRWKSVEEKQKMSNAWTDERKQKQSELLKISWTDKRKQKQSKRMSGINNPHFKKRGSNSLNFGKRRTIESKQKQSLAQQKRWRSFIVISPDGEVIQSINMSQFCRDYNLNIGNFYSLLNGKIKSHKGWKLAV